MLLQGNEVLNVFFLILARIKREVWSLFCKLILFTCVYSIIFEGWGATSEMVLITWLKLYIEMFVKRLLGLKVWFWIFWLWWSDQCTASAILKFICQQMLKCLLFRDFIGCIYKVQYFQVNHLNHYIHYYVAYL